MTQCVEIQGKIQDLLDDRLSESDSSAVRSHLHQCDDCRNYHIEISKMIGWVRSVPDEPAPSGFLDGVIARMSSSPRVSDTSSQTNKRWLLMASPLLAAASLALVAILWNRDSDQELMERKGDPLASLAQADLATGPENIDGSKEFEESGNSFRAKSAAPGAAFSEDGASSVDGRGATFDKSATSEDFEELSQPRQIDIPFTGEREFLVTLIEVSLSRSKSLEPSTPGPPKIEARDRSLMKGERMHDVLESSRDSSVDAPGESDSDVARAEGIGRVEEVLEFEFPSEEALQEFLKVMTALEDQHEAGKGDSLGNIDALSKQAKRAKKDQLIESAIGASDRRVESANDATSTRSAETAEAETVEQDLQNRSRGVRRQDSSSGSVRVILRWNRTH